MKMGIKVVFYFFLILTIILPQSITVGNAFSQEVMVLGGGAGGRFSDVEIDPENSDIIYVTGDNAGIWTSTNGGSTWTCLNNNGLVNYAIADVEIHPFSSNILYVATQGGPFKSINSGRSWKSLRNPGFPPITQDWDKKYHAALACIRVCAQDPNIIYAGCGGSTKFRTREGLLYAGYRSTDGGSTWSPIPNSNGGPDVSKPLVVSSFAWNPDSSKQIYMATNQGLFKSNDYGENWTKLTNGLDDKPVVALEVVSGGPGKIYAATSSETSGGIFTSDDGGLSFRRINPAGSLNQKSCGDIQVINTDAGHRLYASVYSRLIMTDDSGESWTNLGAPPNKGFVNFWGSGIKQFSVAKKDPNQMVTVCDFIIRSNDGGATWTDAYSISFDNNKFKNRGLVNTAPQAIFVNPKNKNHIMLGEYDIGLSQSMDGGITWKNYREYFRLNFQDSPWECFDIIMHDDVYYAMMGRRVANFSWLMKSSDADTWVPIRKFNRFNAKMIAVNNNGKTRLVVAVAGEGVYRSDAPFTNWQIETFGNGAPIAIVKDSNDVVYTALRFWQSQNGGVYKSEDLGATWTSLSNGDWFGDSVCVVVNPTDPSLIFVGTSGYQKPGKGGLFRSTDSGLTWEQVDNTILIPYEDQQKRRIKTITLNSNGSKLFVGLDDAHSSDYNMAKGLFVSNDLGDSFSKIGGLPSDKINCLTANPFDPNSVYVGAEGGGSLKIVLSFKIGRPMNLSVLK